MPEKLKNPKVFIPVLLVIILILAFGTYLVLGNNRKVSTTDSASDLPAEGENTQTSTPETTSDLTWEFNGETWSASGTPPTCQNPILTDLPVNIDLVTNVLYPGQTRGGDYKPHGGFRFDNSQNTDIKVTVPLDALVVEGSRYIENGEVQYLFTLVNPCGIAYRFDHLHTLSEVFQKIASSLPEAKVDDSRTTRFEPPIKVSKGEVVASAVGFVNTKNVAVDFGVYDLRAPNQASKSSSFATAHADEKQFAFYGICWLTGYQFRS